MCAIVGVACHDEAAYLTYLGLQSLQHRGQESAGILSKNGNEYHSYKRKGLVSEIFQGNSLSLLKGDCAIGHNRYSTTGGDIEANIQPLHANSVKSGWMSIAHNGNLVNSEEWKNKFEAQGSIFQTTTDTEIILHLIAKNNKSLPESLHDALQKVDGAYSLLLMNSKYMIAARDPYGFRPLLYGTLKDSPIFASESCAFDLIGGKVHGEVLPGEMIIVDLEKNHIDRHQNFDKKPLNQCVFELIYFSRPDSEVFNKQVYEVRKSLGEKLAEEHPADVDVIIPVPDSGIASAIGFANKLKIPFEMGLVRSHYIRTFIQPKQSLRDLGVRFKLNVVKSCVNGKRIVVVDDSLVRGTTSKKIIRLLRESGAKEVHLRISAPPNISPCFYGIDTPTKKELIASSKSIEEIRNYIGADSLEYLSLKGLQSVSGSGYCFACFNNEYPTIIPLSYKNRELHASTI
jgi:amidophosphoribosyltransferase